MAPLWKYALLCICLLQAVNSALGEHERKLLQAPAPAPELGAPQPSAPPPPPGGCLGDFNFNVLEQNQVAQLTSPCVVQGVTTSSATCCENLQFIGYALLALNSQLNSNIRSITSDNPAGLNAACVKDFNTNILVPNSVIVPTTVDLFCAPYNVEVFPNIEATLQGSTCAIHNFTGVEVTVDLNDLAGICYGPDSCLPGSLAGSKCEDAIIDNAKKLAADQTDPAEVSACAEVVGARLVETHFYESYYSIIQDCGNGTANTALPPTLEFAKSPSNNYSLPPLPPRPPTLAPAPAPQGNATGPAPVPGPAKGPAPAPAPGPAVPPPPPVIAFPPPPPSAAASKTAKLGVFVGGVLLVVSIL